VKEFMMKILFCFLLLANLIIPQTKNPDEILKHVVDNFNKVKDYTADINIKVDVEFIKVPEAKAKLFFKQPDKVHLQSDGFAMLPKDGLEFTPSSLLKSEHTAIYENDVLLNGIKTSVVKVIPLGNQGDIILSTLWIDQVKQLIRKVESTTKTNGIFVIDFSYSDNFKYPLPEEIVFSFNIDKMKMPLITDENFSKEKSKKKINRFGEITKGRVVVKYLNYEVNKGIPDSVFEKKNR